MDDDVQGSAPVAFQPLLDDGSGLLVNPAQNSESPRGASQGVNAPDDPLVARVLATPASRGRIRPVFQPIADLDTDAVVGVEALARWPDAAGADPSAVIDGARALGLVGEVDRACRNAALTAASSSALRFENDLTLFVNGEPDALVGRVDHGEIFTVPTRGLRIVLELTERALLDDPARLLTVVTAARALGLGIALDDVGRNPDSLTLLALIAPDVVKLDRSLIAGPPTRAHLDVITAVNAYAEATGAAILAEGIETDDHRRRAVDIGAGLGKGWLLGPPADRLPTTRSTLPARTPIPSVENAFGVETTPSQLIRRRPRVADKSVLMRYCRHLEQQALSSPEPLTVLASFQHAAFLTDPVAARYAELAALHPLVAVIAVDLPSAPAAGVRGTSIPPAHPLADEWVVVILGRHFFAALIAEDLHTQHDGDDDRPADDPDRQFAYTLTYDRSVVAAAGRALLQHMHPPTGAPTNRR